VMFDEIPGFPKGYRVIANILLVRVYLALGYRRQRVRRWSQIQWWAQLL